MNKYEQLIEHIINENEEAAKELFHQIVVEKSRDIYESLMDEEIGGNASQQFVQDITAQDDAAQDQGLGEDDEEAGEIELGGDDFDHEEETFGDDSDEFGGDEGGEGDIKDTLDDIQAELADLKALLGASGEGESGAEEVGGEEEGESDFDAEEPAGFGESEEVVEAVGSGKSGSGMSGSGKSGSGKSGSGKSGSGVKESYRKSEVEIMKEYVDKIGEIYKQEPAQGEGKTVGTGGDAPAVNTKGVVRGQGPKFDGETAQNIATGGTEQDPDGKQIAEPKNVYAKGRGDLPGAGKFQNVPGAKAKTEKAPAAKKTGEVGGTNTKSIEG